MTTLRLSAGIVFPADVSDLLQPVNYSCDGSGGESRRLCKMLCRDRSLPGQQFEAFPLRRADANLARYRLMIQYHSLTELSPEHLSEVRSTGHELTRLMSVYILFVYLLEIRYARVNNPVEEASVPLTTSLIHRGSWLKRAAPAPMLVGLAQTCWSASTSSSRA
jgi:hypothetical protein